MRNAVLWDASVADRSGRLDGPNRAGPPPPGEEADLSLFFWLRSAQCATVHSALPLSKLSHTGEVPMPKPLLTGPAAASLLGLDGFRDHVWPPMWVQPHTASAVSGIIRTREPLVPVVVAGTRIAPVALVLTHLGHAPEMVGFERGVTARDRVEYALEHALRSGLVTLAEMQSLRSKMPGAQIVRELIALRGNEPPTESFAETTAVHVLRRIGHEPWRQVPILGLAGERHRIDFVIPFRRRARRPPFLGPGVGLGVEIDSREFHEGAFERDHARQSVYDALGLHWITLTPNQLKRPKQVERAIEGALARAMNPRSIRRAS